MNHKNLVKVIDADVNTQEIASAIEASLPQLEQAIKQKFGIETKLHGGFERGRYYKIESEDLMDTYATSVIDKLLFRSICLDFWGGELYTENPYIGYSAHLSYEHVDGGSNGKSLEDGSMFFDIQTHEWMDRKQAQAKYGE